MISLIRQEYFDKSVAGLASQDFERSSYGHGHDEAGCAYRGNHGRKCAIGHLIPDEAYLPKMEGKNVSGYEFSLLFPDEQIHFLNVLQRCHDNGTTPELMKEHLRKFASDYGLVIPDVLKES